MVTFAYEWTERLSWWEAAPLSDAPVTIFEKIICNLGIPEALAMLAMGVIVSVALDAMKMYEISILSVILSAVSAAATLAEHLAAIFKGV